MAGDSSRASLWTEPGKQYHLILGFHTKQANACPEVDDNLFISL